jgi:hypothetical protein
LFAAIITLWDLVLYQKGRNALRALRLRIASLEGKYIFVNTFKAARPLLKQSAPQAQRSVGYRAVK